MFVFQDKDGKWRDSATGELVVRPDNSVIEVAVTNYVNASYRPLGILDAEPTMATIREETPEEAASWEIALREKIMRGIKAELVGDPPTHIRVRPEYSWTEMEWSKPAGECDTPKVVRREE